jgi:hypothetical protein
MSEFHLVALDLLDQEALILALEELGYHPVVHQQPQHLEGYVGDKRSQKAHIIIPRKQISSASNDIGFENVNGTFVMHISEYDEHSNRFNINKLKQLYAKHLIVKNVQKKWLGKYKLKSQTVDENNSIRITLKRII